jgi:hypothetical protein
MLGPTSPVSEESDFEEGEVSHSLKKSEIVEAASPVSDETNSDQEQGEIIDCPFWSSSGKLPSSDTREVGDNPCFPLLRSYLEILSLSPSSISLASETGDAGPNKLS